MQKSREPVVQHIPFVAGKSLNNSHNIGVRIQQTKSLMIKTQSNKKVKPKKPPLSPSHEHIGHKGHSITTTTLRRRNSDTCPVLKYQSHMKPRHILDESEDEEKKIPKEKQSIEEIWANYMFDVESKNILPIRCTCFPLKTKKVTPTNSRNVKDELAKKANRQKTDHASIYTEVIKQLPIQGARKIMNDCREVLNSSEEELCRDDLSIVEDNTKKPTRSTKMARYMQQIKQLQERLSK